jgi:hypothetical protein
VKKLTKMDVETMAGGVWIAAQSVSNSTPAPWHCGHAPISPNPKHDGHDMGAVWM